MKSSLRILVVMLSIALLAISIIACGGGGTSSSGGVGGGDDNCGGFSGSRIGPNTVLDIANNDYDIYISRTVTGGGVGHLGGIAVGDINGDGIDDFVVSSIQENVSRLELESGYLPGDQDAWTEKDISLWTVSGNAGSLAASTVHVAGNNSISTTRTGSGSAAMRINFSSSFGLSSTEDTLYFQVYVEDSNEQLDSIDIWAPNYSNRFRYNYTPNLALNNGGWTQIDLNLSNFSIEAGSPDWNDVGGVRLGFWGGSSGDIKIDEFYFDYSGYTTTKAGAVYLFYGGLTPGDILVNSADVTIYGIDAGDLTGEYITTGDINNDNYDDIIIGTAMDDGPGNGREDAGAVYVIFGGSTLPSLIDLKTDTADYIVYGADAEDLLGEIVHTSDINADGISDLIMGALSGDGFGNGGEGNGEIHIVLGSENLSGVLDLTSANADISIYGKDYEALGRQGTIGVGDIYNDEQVDLIIGVWGGERPGEPQFTNAGNVFIIDDISNYSGAIDLASTTPDTVIYGADNGDRLAKIAIGDFNNDGIEDIIVGAEEADGLNNSKTGVGEVYVFFGSSSLPSEIDLNSTNADVRIIGIDAGDNLGVKVYAGDVTDDGVDDILSIAPGGDGENNAKTNSGDVYVIYGNSNRSGIIDLSVTPPEVIVYGADDNDELRDVFGGDISGDCIDDLIFGSKSADGPNNAYSRAGDIMVIYGGGIQ